MHLLWLGKPVMCATQGHRHTVTALGRVRPARPSLKINPNSAPNAAMLTLLLKPALRMQPMGTIEVL